MNDETTGLTLYRGHYIRLLDKRGKLTKFNVMGIEHLAVNFNKIGRENSKVIDI